MSLGDHRHGFVAAVAAMHAEFNAYLDAAVLAGITAAAGTVLVEAGVGAIVGYGLAALEVARIIELIGKAGKIIQTG